MENFIKFIREDGVVEYRHPNYDKLMEEADALVPDEPIEISAEEMVIAALNVLRKIRNQKIAETDWRATIDYPGDDQAAWLEYRQALRDITNTYTSLDNVVWPVPPGESNGS